MTTRTFHHLKDLKGRKIATWQNWPRWDDIQAEVAEWADCDPEEVAEIETPGGDFLTVDGIPVAYVDREPFYIPGPNAKVIPITVDGRPALQIYAAE